MNIYSIKNEKLEFFNRPIYCESSNEALTLAQNILMSDSDRALIGLRSDLALYFLGTIDFVSGKIDAVKKPIRIEGLDKIFDSIPEDKVPRTEHQLRDLIHRLSDEVDDLKISVLTLENSKEGDCIAEKTC